MASPHDVRMRGFAERADVEEVERFLAERTRALEAEAVELLRCTGRVLAEGDAVCLLAITAEAHAAGHFDVLRYGGLSARRGRLGPDQCISCWKAKQLHDWLASKR